MRITLSQRDTPDFQIAADLVQDVFATQYQASIRPNPDAFLAYFESAEDGTESALACAGLSFPEQDNILLERYLDAPVEKVIADELDAPVAREQILQIGNIASVRASAGGEIIKALPLVMACLGRPYAVMTMTGRLAMLMQRLGVVFHPLVDASRDALSPQEAAQWGSYYDTRPVVGWAEAAAQSTLLLAAIGRYCFESVDMRFVSNRPEQRVLTRAA
ncbi:thermostable hemolysin [Streptomyces brasiliensis]|uniref:Thermostable hemolysin n=1 Tax=Streptomyces brasiliensis TaxID=1954 RepID=A0A917P345_9ACTN|nr:thermostable hemolysin [Streptomyces brasiliensis]GGJ51388.1 thermostable hemolysin [Streptomyces brasiliensis]